MILCAAQIRSAARDIDGNIARHLAMIDTAAGYGAACIIFPELSVTGYEPTHATALAVKPDTARFDIFRRAAMDRRMLIGVGAPLSTDTGIL